MEIVLVNNKSLTKKFIDFPHDLYRNDEYYVPQLYLGVADKINPKKNPWFIENKADLFLALEGNKVVGRIAAIRNNTYNNFHKDNTGFFGFFDVIEDETIAHKLLAHAEQWVEAEGLTGMIGPTNFSTNDTSGLLIDGFDGPPVIEMTYNYRYYQTYIENYGYKKGMDLLAYLVDQKTVNRRSIDLSTKIKARLEKKGFVFRKPVMKNFAAEVAKIRDVYIDTWENNWGFVPPTAKEFEFLAKEMKMIVDPDLIPIVEHEGKVIAFSLAIPDYNIIFKNVKRGRLLPTGIFKLLFGKKKINLCRIILLGVHPDYRGMGIDAILYANAITGKYRYGEGSWILENNTEMNAGLIKLNGAPYRRYRVYKKDI